MALVMQSEKLGITRKTSLLTLSIDIRKFMTITSKPD